VEKKIPGMVLGASLLSPNDHNKKINKETTTAHPVDAALQIKLGIHFEFCEREIE